MIKNCPIGIFDSGIGGLTVAQALRQLLPNESIVYFGDTLHLPYGDKSEQAIKLYCKKIVDYLLSMNCKIIVMACNSASSVGYELTRSYVGNRAQIINVIDPMVLYVAKHYQYKNVGLIGTRRTVESEVYKRKIEEKDKGINFFSLATPLLAPMIEEGYYNNQISMRVIEDYLKDSIFDDLDALILGCTHYPLIKNQINHFFGLKVDVLESSEISAKAIETLINENNLANNGKRAKDKFFVTDYTTSFQESTKMFFRESVKLEWVKV